MNNILSTMNNIIGAMNNIVSGNGTHSSAHAHRKDAFYLLDMRGQ